MGRKIADIKKGKLSADIFVREIENYVCDIIKDNYTVTIENNSIETVNICPQCGGKMILKKGKYGKFQTFLIIQSVSIFKKENWKIKRTFYKKATIK